jgi:hypothetical protein
MTMKIMLRSVLFIGALMILNQSAFSEYRVWTDQDGKTIEAEYVTSVGDKIVLRNKDGSEMRVSIDDTDRENKGRSFNRGAGFQVQRESVQVDVSIHKTSPAPYEAPLRAELYLIGKPENTDAYVVIGQKSSKFQFTTENKYEHDFSSGTVHLKQVEAGRQVGLEYEGYLVAVRDRKGEVVEIKASKLDFSKNAEAIMGSERGEVFDEDFKKVDMEEMRKRKEKKKLPTPGKRFPGRKF